MVSKLMDINQMGSIILQFLILLIIFLGLIQAEESVLIDTKTDLDLVEGTTPSTCEYMPTQDVLCKYFVENPGNTGYWSSCYNPRCDISISVGLLGNLGRVPNSVSVLSFVNGTDAGINIRYRPIPGAMPMPVPNAPTILNTNWEWSSQIDLSKLDLHYDSEIVLRLSSGPLKEYADIIDKILFTFEEPSTEPSTIGTTPSSFTGETSTVETTPSSFTGETSTVETTPSAFTRETSTVETTPSSFTGETSTVETIPSAFTRETSTVETTPSSFTGETSTVVTIPSPFTGETSTVETTELPTTICPVMTTPAYTATPFPETTIGTGVPDLVLDLDSDLVAGWINVDCAYESRPEEFTKCPNDITIAGWNSEGLWSSCEHTYCTLMFALGRYVNPLPPTSVTVTSYVTGDAVIEVSARAKGSDYGVGIISGTSGWSNSTFDLTHLPLDDESRIYLEPKSSTYPASVDLIDKVFISFK